MDNVDSECFEMYSKYTINDSDDLVNIELSKIEPYLNTNDNKILMNPAAEAFIKSQETIPYGIKINLL